MREETPHFSTVSYNFRRRFTSETADGIFAWVLEEAANAGYLPPKAVFIDDTHIKANAGTKKQVKAEIPATAKRYAAELMGEVNADWEAHSKNCVKTVQRHIRKDYEELADDARYTPEYHELYRQRKEKIERVFADSKEKHAMRYTQYRGLAQVTNWVKLKFAAINLKKPAKAEVEEAHFLFPLRPILPTIRRRTRLALDAQPGSSTVRSVTLLQMRHAFLFGISII